MDKKMLIAMGTAVYLLSSFASYGYFKMRNSADQSSYQEPEIAADGTLIDNSPKTEACPLNGQLYSKNQKAKWESRRPLGIMVQNNTEARPQSGLSSADIIYEAVAEGGITRLLGIYYCENPEIVGSVRSARIYFIRLLQGFGNNPLYAHVGGANTPGPADALGEIKKLKWNQYNDLDQFAVAFPNYWRDYDRLPGRATEHTVYTNTNKLWDFAEKNRKLTNVDVDGERWDESWKPWNFTKDAKESERGSAGKISYGFWDDKLGTDYIVVWNYDPSTNKYLRTNGGKPHIDFNTNEQLSMSNVIVVFADESVAKDGYEKGQHLLYNLKGAGEAISHQNGQTVEGTWKKAKDTDMIRFYNKAGKEVELTAGKIWISILPTGNEVIY